MQGQQPEGFLTHVCRRTDQGFEVMETWDTKEHQEAFRDQILDPAMEAVGFKRGVDSEWSSFEPHAVTMGRQTQDA